MYIYLDILQRREERSANFRSQNIKIDILLFEVYLLNYKSEIILSLSHFM